MPDYQAMEDAHLADPPARPAHDQEDSTTGKEVSDHMSITDRLVTVQEYGDEIAPNGQLVAYNLGKEIMAALSQIPEEDYIQLFTACSENTDSYAELEDRLNRWHESVTYVTKEV